MKALINREDTIVAPATAPGQAAIAVIRISGPRAFDIVHSVFEPFGKKNKQKTQDAYPCVRIGKIKKDGQWLDEVVVLFYKSPRSFTGEDVAEISCHGSPYIVQEIITLLTSCGARMAEPGEFTLRAFLNGKMDLTKAEAIGELIASESGMMHQVAREHYRGEYRKILEDFRSRLVHFLSMLELELDFAEEDVEFARRDELLDLVRTMKSEMKILLESFEWGNALKKGIPVVILGKPNAGKSTLMNRLAREEKSIVSEIPGTTRDLIEDVIYLKGIPFRFTDTAGLRESGDIIEQKGVEKALDALKKSLILIYLFDVNMLGPGDLKKELHTIQHQWNYTGRIFLVGNKTDLCDRDSLQKEFSELQVYWISAKNGSGVQELEEALVKVIEEDMMKFGNRIVTNSLHADSLRKSIEALEKTEHAMQQGISTEWISSDIRQIVRELDLLTGKIQDEEILNYIFSNFCIGK